MVALKGLLYPIVVFLSLATLALTLVRIDGRRLARRRSEGPTYCSSEVAVTLVMAASSPGQASRFAPVVSADAARHAPEFGPEGPSKFYAASRGGFGVLGGRSSLLPVDVAEWPFVVAAIGSAPLHGVDFLVVDRGAFSPSYVRFEPGSPSTRRGSGS